MWLNIADISNKKNPIKSVKIELSKSALIGNNISFKKYHL
jgi:hypothetical protein